MEHSISPDKQRPTVAGVLSLQDRIDALLTGLVISAAAAGDLRCKGALPSRAGTPAGNISVGAATGIDGVNKRLELDAFMSTSSLYCT